MTFLSASFAEPEDGWQPMERILLRDLVVSLYRTVRKPNDKFILMAIFESGYSQTEVAMILGVSQVAVYKRITEIKKYLDRIAKHNKI